MPLTESAINELLTAYPPVSLEQLDTLVLMNRVDEKYVMNIEALPGILGHGGEDYHILEIDGVRYFRYETQYFDTPDNDLYNAHHNGKINRYKIRIRKYLQTGKQFLEVKFKTKKDKTLKKRIEADSTEGISHKSIEKFFKKNDIPLPDMLEPRIITEFSRFTLLNFTRQERITVDTNISFRAGGKSVTLGPVAILELKHEGGNSKGGMAALLKSNQIKKAGMSKYCIGMALLYPDIKYNSFKKRILNINKTCHANLVLPNS